MVPLCFSWTFDQAFNYMKDNTAMSDNSITRELKRYIGWPGQVYLFYFKYGYVHEQYIIHSLANGESNCIINNSMFDIL